MRAITAILIKYVTFIDRKREPKHWLIRPLLTSERSECFEVRNPKSQTIYEEK